MITTIALTYLAMNLTFGTLELRNRLIEQDYEGCATDSECLAQFDCDTEIDPDDMFAEELIAKCSK